MKQRVLKKIQITRSTFLSGAQTLKWLNLFSACDTVCGSPSHAATFFNLPHAVRNERLTSRGAAICEQRAPGDLALESVTTCVAQLPCNVAPLYRCMDRPDLLPLCAHHARSAAIVPSPRRNAALPDAPLSSHEPTILLARRRHASHKHPVADSATWRRLPMGLPMPGKHVDKIKDPCRL